MNPAATPSSPQPDQATYAWKAMHTGMSLITVLADNEDVARRRIRELLDRPGRYGILRAWELVGAVVQRVGT